MSDAAEFDRHDHCTRAGWATYLWPLGVNFRCRVFGHRTDAPVPRNDYCPAAYSCCDRCKDALRWFNVGTHRFGGRRSS